MTQKIFSRRNHFLPAEFQSEEQRDLYDWMYEFSLDNERPLGRWAWGMAMGIALDHPEWSMWQVMAELRRRVTVVTVPAQSA